MWNLEQKETNQLDFIKQKAIDFLKKTWELQEYKKIIPVKITNNIFAIKSETWNISFYINSKWEQLFSTLWIYKDLWQERYNKYLRKLWYKEIKDDNWYYHMINLRTWKEIPQESLQYYEIFEILWKVDYRLDVTKNIFEADNVIKWKDNPQKRMWLELSKLVNDELLVWIWVEKWVIKPFEINYLYYQKQLSEQEARKYLKQTLTFKYLSNLINNQAIDLVWEQGFIPVTLDGKTYRITFWPVTKEELDYYKAKNWINEQMYEELLKVLEEHKKLEEKKEQEKKEHIEKTKKHISNLKNNISK